MPWRDVRSVRASLLLAAVNSFRPTVVLVDKHPLGVGGELEPALERTRAAGAGAVLGLRDVLDDPAAVHAEMCERGLFTHIARYYDRLLVYGQPDILDALREYAFPKEVAAMTCFCGYVVAAETAAGGKGSGNGSTASPTRRGRPHVLATAGGGEDGVALLAAFVEAAARSRWDAGVVSGPQCDPRDVHRLGDLADRAGVDFRRFVPGLSSEFPTLDALVCMGGYNTLAEAAASGVSTVCVPRVRPRSEQLIRAQAFERLGLLTVVEPGTSTRRSSRPRSSRRSRGSARRGRTRTSSTSAERAARPVSCSSSRPRPPATSAGPKGSASDDRAHAASRLRPEALPAHLGDVRRRAS